MKKTLLFIVALLFIISEQSSAQITLPNETFLPGQIISAGPTNANFGVLGDQALNRTGGTITGHITFNADVTIDGADVSDYLDGSGRVRVTTPGLSFLSTGDTTTGWVVDSGTMSFVLSSVARGTLNASGLTIYGNTIFNNTGKITNISTTYFGSVSGAEVLPGESSIADGALLARLAAGETISGQWSFSTGSVSVNTPQTFQANWNNAGVTFTGVLVDITSTASGAASAPLDLKLAGVSKVNVSKVGKVTAATAQVTGGAANNYIYIGDGSGIGSWTPSASASPLPSGMFAWFEAACPVGWTIKSDAANTYNAKLPRGGATFSGAGGGSDTHTHATDPANTSSTAVSADHTHSFDLASATVDASGDTDHDLSGSLASAGGSHAGHSFTTGTENDIANVADGGDFSAGWNHTHSATVDSTDVNHTHGLGSITDTSRDGGHAHTENFAATTSGGISTNHQHDLDIGSFSSGSGSSVPAYVQVVVCRKD